MLKLDKSDRRQDLRIYKKDGSIGDGLPKCALCRKRVWFGIIIQSNPAIFDGEGNARVSRNPKYWKVIHLCRPCARRNAYL